ncbi:hypothetical protein [Atlantibacter hermannii]|uniref:hypothetical protein n=1 Tax=Atlantibacter hermannii TaxID=565 RepID=UPI003DA75EB1
MALVNTPSGSVDILNRNTGDLVTQFSGAGDRVINITQSSVVKLMLLRKPLIFMSDRVMT